MLVLTRKKHERIVVPLTATVLRDLMKLIPPGGEDDGKTALASITIVVTEIRGDKTRLGVSAPETIPVHRQEIYEQIMSGNGHAKGVPVPKTIDLDPSTVGGV